MRILRIGLIALLFVTASVFRQAAGQKGQLPAKPIQMVTPVFHELVLFSLPSTFQIAVPEQVNQAQYLREMPLRGETVERWTQLVTLTGANDLAKKPGTTPQSFAATIAHGYQSACPATFSQHEVAHPDISGKKTTIVLMGCGAVADEGGAPGAKHSEAALVMVIAGASDIYTLQWGERGPVQGGPVKFDEVRWEERLKHMQPIKICPVVAGEKAPYASCLAQ